MSELKSGQVYVFRIPCMNPIGHTFARGEEIELLEPTGQNPHGFMSNDGINWLCKASNGITIWSTISWAVGLGYLELKV